jgi:hypothetical protein
MRVCSKCLVEKEDSDFAFRHKERGIRQHICRLCHSTENKEHYLNNKSKAIARTARNKKKGIVKYRDFKKTLKCSKCGYNKCVSAIEFHHMGSQKKENVIAVLIGTGCFKRAYEEMKKCEVVCSNCHRELHEKERSFI